MKIWAAKHRFISIHLHFHLNSSQFISIHFQFHLSSKNLSYLIVLASKLMFETTIVSAQTIWSRHLWQSLDMSRTCISLPAFSLQNTYEAWERHKVSNYISNSRASSSVYIMPFFKAQVWVQAKFIYFFHCNSINKAIVYIMPFFKA